MISKLDLTTILGQPCSPIKFSIKGGHVEFESLLKEKIEEWKPLERMVLQYLNKTVLLALSETKPEEDDLVFSLPPPFPLSTKSSAPERGPFLPQEIAVPVENIVSNNLQGKQDFESIVRQAGQKYGVDPFLIKAVMQVESSGNPMAVSKAGAQGLMQIMPKTAAELGVKNPFDPAENVMGGTLYLRRLLDRYHGNVKLTLAAYNWGMGNLENRPEAMPKETKQYITKVENQYHGYAKA
jgi:hypothetical protein